MADTNQEVNARVVLENRSGPAHGPITPEAHLANLVREQMNQGPDSTLGWMKGLKEERNPGEINSVIDQAIGINIDSATGKKDRVAGSDEETRFNKAKAVADLVEKFKSVKYDGLTGVEQNQLRDHIKGLLTAWPDANAFFSNLPAGPLRDAAINAATERILRDSNFVPFVAQTLNEATDSSKLPPEFNQELKAKEEQLRRKRDAKNKEITDRTTGTSSKIRKLGDNIRDFNSTGTKGSELLTLTTEEPVLVSELKAFNATKKTLTDERDAQEYIKKYSTNAADRATAAGEVVRLNREISNLETTEIAPREGKLLRKKQLEEERKSYEEDRAQLQEKEEKLKEELSDLDYELSKAQTSLASAKNRRVEQENNFVNGVESVFATATARYIETTLAKANAIQDSLLEENQKRNAEGRNQALSQIEARVLSQLTKQWDTDRPVSILGFRSKVIKETNRDAVNRDFNLLVSNNSGEGVDRVFEDYLTASGVTDPAERASLLNNKEFRDKMQPQILEALVAKKLQIGHMREGDARRIVESPWGADLINKAIAKNEAAQKQIDALRNKGIITGDFMTWLGSRSGVDLLAIILALLGGAVVGAGMVLANPAAMGIAAMAPGTVGAAGGIRAGMNRLAP